MTTTEDALVTSIGSLVIRAKLRPSAIGVDSHRVVTSKLASFSRGSTTIRTGGDAESIVGRTNHFQICRLAHTPLEDFVQRNTRRRERRGVTAGIWHSRNFQRMVKYARKTSIRRVRLPDRSPKRVQVTSYVRRNRRK